MSRRWMRAPTVHLRDAENERTRCGAELAARPGDVVLAVPAPAAVDFGDVCLGCLKLLREEGAQ